MKSLWNFLLDVWHGRPCDQHPWWRRGKDSDLFGDGYCCRIGWHEHWKRVEAEEKAAEEERQIGMWTQAILRAWEENPRLLEASMRALETRHALNPYRR